MISEVLLRKIGFLPDEIELLLASDNEALAQLAADYMSENGQHSDTPYTPEEFTKKRDRAQSCLLRARAICPSIHKYTAELLFWLHCVPHAEKYYRENGIRESVFWDSMYDLVCKTRMCRKNYDIVGVYIDWFYLIFDYQVFALGRLQFYTERFEADCYQWQDITLKRGDPVYSCHIPANGKLDIDACMDSFQQAYEFFKDKLSSCVIPITCESWLLYPPYVQKVFVKDSNMARFAALFDIIGQHSTGKRFLDARNVFGRFIDDDIASLPRQTRLQQNFIHFIEEGNDFGSGYGILLYDGVQRRILNTHHF